MPPRRTGGRTRVAQKSRAVSMTTRISKTVDTPKDFEELEAVTKNRERQKLHGVFGDHPRLFGFIAGFVKLGLGTGPEER